MERILIFGNTHESREAAQTMRRRGKQVIVCVTTEYARAQLPPGTLCHIGRFDDGQMLSYIRQTNPRKVIDATHPYATATQMRIRRSAEQLGIPCQRMKIENEQEAWRDVVQWVENPAEAVAVLSKLSEENILLAGDYRNLPHYAPLLRKDHLFCRIMRRCCAKTTCSAALCRRRKRWIWQRKSACRRRTLSPRTAPTPVRSTAPCSTCWALMCW